MNLSGEAQALGSTPSEFTTNLIELLAELIIVSAQRLVKRQPDAHLESGKRLEEIRNETFPRTHERAIYGIHLAFH
ncbi:MAG: hypothetical protein ABSH29_26040 [Acidimicrobiales bacterium]|jgi:hypothetical protein